MAVTITKGEGYGDLQNQLGLLDPPTRPPVDDEEVELEAPKVHVDPEVAPPVDSGDAKFGAAIGLGVPGRVPKSSGPLNMRCRATKDCEGRQVEEVFDKNAGVGGRIIRFRCLTCRGSFMVQY